MVQTFHMFCFKYEEHLFGYSHKYNTTSYLMKLYHQIQTGPDFFPSPRQDERKTPEANPWKVCPPPAPTGGNIPITGGYLRWLLSWPHSSYLGMFYW